MSRRIRGETPAPIVTSMATEGIFGWGREPALHKLVDVTCDDCGAQGVTFDKRLPDGWEHRQRLRGSWPVYPDLCPTCAARPEPPGDGTTIA